MPDLSLSIVIPVYAGENYISTVVNELQLLRISLSERNAPFNIIEAIFVDDAAVDSSIDILRNLSHQYTWIKIVTLSRNYGQHPATIAGVLYTSGDWVVTIDEDMQHHPGNIPDMLKIVASLNCDIVYATPKSSVHGGFFRDYSSKYYKLILAKLTCTPSIPKFNSFRLLRGTVARAAASVCGYDTYFDIALTWFTDKTEVFSLNMTDVRHSETGFSGYSFYKLLSHARRMIVSTQTKLLRIGAVVGILSMLLAILLGFNIVFNYIINPEFVDVRGWTSLFIGILFFGGIAAFLLGIILEYLTNLVMQSQGKPVYFVVDRSADKKLSDYFAV